MKHCSKPGCSGTGTAVLGYDYAARRAVLFDPDEGELSPHLYALCTPCAERLRPPRGWQLSDQRSAPPLFLDGDEELTSLDPELETAEPAIVRRQLFFGAST